jgi:hypothetical protein
MPDVGLRLFEAVLTVFSTLALDLGVVEGHGVVYVAPENLMLKVRVDCLSNGEDGC